MTITERKRAANREWSIANRERKREIQRDYERRNGVEIRDREREVIAIDGEGISLPHWYAHGYQPVRIRGTIPSPYVEYRGSLPKESADTLFGRWLAQDHIYTLLMASTGERIAADGGNKGLTTKECFDFLLSLSKPNRIIVGYAISYDINMMIGDLPKERLERLYRYGNIRWEGYTITWIPRKQLSIGRGRRNVTVWDIFGYFQSSFADALSAWKVTAQSEIDAIEDMKLKRGNFDKQDRGSIEAYCLSECRLCVELFNKLLECCARVGVRPSRYDGAGSIAAALMKRERIKDYLGYPISEDSALSAYYGGRFEMRQQGLFDRLYAYDIQSAYPSALVDCPCFAHSTVRYHGGYNNAAVESPFGLSAVTWDIPSDPYERGFGPFPVRDSGGHITYPLAGKGHYWNGEVKAAMGLYGGYINVIETYSLENHCDHQPFLFLRTLFQERKQLKAIGDLGHLVLKLGYNSCYGKTAQALGGRGKPPAYRNWLVASWVTSHCRAKILAAIRLSMGGVISIATDGILSTSPIPSLSTGTELGEWEYHTVNDAFLVHPGIYSYSEDGKSTVKCGGFTRREGRINELREGFIKHGPKAERYYDCTRFMTLGAALMRKALDSGWRCWVTERKVVRMVLHNRTITTPTDNPPYSVLESAMFKGDITTESMPFNPKKTWQEDFDAPSFDILSLLLESPD